MRDRWESLTLASAAISLMRDACPGRIDNHDSTVYSTKLTPASRWSWALSAVGSQTIVEASAIHARVSSSVNQRGVAPSSMCRDYLTREVNASNDGFHIK